MKHFCYLLILAACLSACKREEISPTAPVSDTTVVQGTVREVYSNGTPIQGAKICILKNRFTLMGTYVDTIGKAVTDEKGKYSITLVQWDGRYSVGKIVCVVDSIVESSDEFYIQDGIEDVFVSDTIVEDFGDEMGLNKNLYFYAKSFVSYKVKSKTGIEEEISLYLMINGDTVPAGNNGQAAFGPMLNTQFMVSKTYEGPPAPITISAAIYPKDRPMVLTSKTIEPVPGKVSVFYLEY